MKRTDWPRGFHGVLGSTLGFALLSFSASAAVAADPAADSPTEGLEEITVTATRHAEPAEHVPVSINVFNDRMLREANLKSVSDLATVSPGFQYAEPQANPSTILTLAIRGMNTSTGEAVVGVYYDDTPMQTRLSSPTNFTSLLPVVFDLNRVEILNGPQGTLFGAGAEAGAVRFIPNGPNMREFSGYTHAEVGRNERGGMSYELQGAFGGPVLQDEAGFRIAAYDRRDGGWVDLVNPIPKDINPGAAAPVVDANANTRDNKAVRASLALLAGENLIVTPAFYYQDTVRGDSGRFYKIFSGAAGGAYPVSEFASGRLAPEQASDIAVLPTLKIEEHLPFADLTAVGSYLERTAHVSLDQGAANAYQAFLYNPPTPDCAPQTVVYTPGVGYSTPCNSGTTFGSALGAVYPTSPDDLNNTKYAQQIYQTTAEVRLASNHPDAFVTWVAGMFYSHVHQTDSQLMHSLIVDPTGAEIFRAAQTVLDNQLAVFANVDLHVTHKLTVTLGERVSRVKSDLHTVNGHGIYNVGEPTFYSTPSQKETPTTPRVSVAYQADNANLFYATFAKGFRLGGGNSSIPATCGDFPQTYKSDTLNSFEVGEKSTLFNGKLQLDYSLFHAKWSNIQQLNFINPAICPFAYTFNAGEAVFKGFDLTLRGVFTRELTAGVNVGYVDASYTQTLFASSGAQLTQAGDTVGITPQVNAPWNANGWLDYGIALANGDKLTLRGEYKWKSHNNGPYVTNLPQGANSANYYPNVQADPSYSITNARITYTRGPMDLGFFVENVFNNHPLLQMNQESNAVDFYTYSTLAPRTFGLSANYRFGTE
jgi:outer membrane receptor protein involved in Fe transport